MYKFKPPGPAQAVAHTLSFKEWCTLLSQSVTPAIEMNIKRRYRRYNVSGDARGEIDCDGERLKRSWPLLEVSAKGLTLKSHEPLPAGSIATLEVNFDGHWHPLRGTVVHSTETLGGYKLGLKLIFRDG